MKKRTALFACVLALLTVFTVAVFAADDIQVPLGDKLSFRGINATASDGVLDLELTGMNEKHESPAIFFPGVDIDASVYRFIKMEVKSDVQPQSKGFSHGFYFRTENAQNFSEDKKISVELQQKSDDFVEYTFDMGTNGDWAGKVTGIFYSFNDLTGKVQIKNIRFVEGSPVKKIMLTDAEKITDLPTPSKTVIPSKFSKSRTYTDAFTDVTVKDWFYDAVSGAYEFALVNGDSATTYNPEGTMTVAEAVTLASRMHSTVKGDGASLATAEGDAWYSNYVNYAKQEGFLKDGMFDSFDREIKRHEMVTLFAAALPEEYFETLNYVTHIPDVSSDAAYAKAVLMFYNAGICMGNDIYGTFNPDSNITRSEVAAIADRIADKAHRLDKDLAVRVNPESAYWLVEDSGYSTRNTIKETLQSGWDYDNRGGSSKSKDEPPYPLSDISATEPVTLTRTLTVQDAGVVTTEFGVTFNSAFDGWYMETLSTSGTSVYKLFTKNNEFYVLDNGEEKSLGVKPTLGKPTIIRIDTDLAARTNRYELDGKNCGTFGFATGAAIDVAVFRTGTTDEAIMDTSVYPLRMYCNYLVNDSACTKVIPDSWTVEQTGNMTVESSGGEFVFNGNTGKASMSKSFKPVSGNISTELIMLYPDMADGFTYALTSGGTPIVSFTTKDGKMYANGKELRSYSNYMWYMVRLYADTATQKATIKVSGKTIATDIPFASAASTLDGLYLASENNGGKTLKLDDIIVEKIVDYADYPSEPKLPAGADDYYIGINVCNLWRNGHHWGWDNISPYDENKPVLGWYDEGLPEVADWEIKFMVEHGVDFQLICWYHSGDAPFKTFYGSTPKALLEGFMNAKYSEKYGKFALLWEAANGVKPQNLDDFKSRFVEYWVEYFFSDPRYMVIDNKPVMSIFGADHLKNSFGGTEAGVKEAFDYLRSRIKEMGYDDIIIMACDGSADKAHLQSLANMGIDAVQAYNWGNAAYSAAWNQQKIADQQKNGAGVMHNVPTVSTGFNNIAWAYTRYPLITTENMEQVLTWVRDSALNKYEITGNGDEWKKKFVMLSTWNEYGEGTYMMPAGLNGFGYLDTVRKVFTKGTNHTDEQPNTLQMARLGHMYPINREIIRPQGYYEAPEASTVIYEEKFAENGTALWGSGNCTVSADGDILTGTASNNDPILYRPDTSPKFKATEIKQVKVWVDGPVGDNVEVYFLTDSSGNWSADKGTAAKITQKGMHPVVVNLSSLSTWTGTITALRIDPITSQNNFRVEKVQFLGNPITERFLLNGNEVQFDFEPVNVDGDKLIPFFPDDGIGYRLGCAYTWDKVNKKLTLTKNGKQIVFTMGSKKITVNGEPVSVNYAPYLEDGIPMVPLHFIVDTFGYQTETKTADDGVKEFNVITLTKDVYDIISKRVENEWEFNLTGDGEGWQLGNATATVINGSFYGNDMDQKGGWGGHYDPALSSPALSIEANRYKTLKVRMKHEIQAEKTEENKGEFQLVVYFKTSSAGLSEGRTFRADLEKTSNGDFIEYTFDLSSHPEWAGEITGLRIDPFNNVPGEFWIDWIRFE